MSIRERQEKFLTLHSMKILPPFIIYHRDNILRIVWVHKIHLMMYQIMKERVGTTAEVDIFLSKTGTSERRVESLSMAMILSSKHFSKGVFSC